VSSADQRFYILNAYPTNAQMLYVYVWLRLSTDTRSAECGKQFCEIVNWRSPRKAALKIQLCDAVNQDPSAISPPLGGKPQQNQPTQCDIFVFSIWTWLGFSFACRFCLHKIQIRAHRCVHLHTYVWVNGISKFVYVTLAPSPHGPHSFRNYGSQVGAGQEKASSRLHRK